MDTKLMEFYADWQRWADAADQSENGWEADYPCWDELIDAAITTMTSDGIDEQLLQLVAACWAISNESEVLADYARDHLEECWPVVVTVARSSFPNARWQAYDVLPHAGERAEPVLREGLDDPDPYCRRRAILALARLHPADAAAIARRFTEDDDEYIRRAAAELYRE